MRPAIHPGEILRDELVELGVTPTELSRQINVPPNRVTQIIHGRRSVTGDTALRLGRWFGSSARFWLNLQTAYDIRTAEERVGPEISQLRQRQAPSAPFRHNNEMMAPSYLMAGDPDLPSELAATKKRKAKKAAAKRPAPAKKRA
jgi:addiction module HigA family antidote